MFTIELNERRSVAREASSAIGGGWRHVAWYGAGAAFAFLMPFVFTSVLELHHDVYYLLYFSGVAAFLATYASVTGADFIGLFRRNWRWSLALGLLSAAFVVLGVLNREESTPHPTSLYFAFEVVWRGLAYGVVDALLLTAFPASVAYALLLERERVHTLLRRASFAALAFALVLIITATYHLGYEQFREDSVAAPETGNAIISIPALVTVNPLGSVVAHSAMHVAAVIHAYETDVYLPPQTDAE